VTTTQIILSNLKQLHQDYSDVQEEEPSVKETVSSVFNFHSASEDTGLLLESRSLEGRAVETPGLPKKQPYKLVKICSHHFFS